MKPTPEQDKRLRQAGFKLIFVNDDEFEDGVGTRPGWNAVKDGVWYTTRQALAEISEAQL